LGKDERIFQGVGDALPQNKRLISSLNKSAHVLFGSTRQKYSAFSDHWHHPHWDQPIGLPALWQRSFAGSRCTEHLCHNLFHHCKSGKQLKN
jgi:hypothetical protein